MGTAGKKGLWPAGPVGVCPELGHTRVLVQWQKPLLVLGSWEAAGLPVTPDAHPSVDMTAQLGLMHW